MTQSKDANATDPSRRDTFHLSAAYIVLAVMILFFVYDLLGSGDRGSSIPYSQFLSYLEEGRVSSVTLSDSTMRGELHAESGSELQKFHTIVFEDDDLLKRLQAHKVIFQREVRSPVIEAILAWVLPLILFVGIWTYIGRRIAGGVQGGVMSLSKSKAKVFMETTVQTTFADVAGVDEAEEELREVVQFLKDPQRYARLGGRVPKGLLLVGPPGTGKTMLARAVAGEANVPFFSINGSEFVELFVGLGAARVRDLFTEARRNVPCLVFIDEIDALGKSRGLGPGNLGASDEKEQTLNKLLAEMDGFDPKEGVIVFAATNRPEILDQALLRAGRFDRQILVALPDQVGRTDILKVHLHKITVDPQLDPAKIAALTPGFSGADLANLVNEAALVATRRDAAQVVESDFTQAVERLVAGLEQKKKLMNPDEKRKVAFHEMGHATVALAFGTGEKVHKVSIIPRGIGALGYTLRRPTEDRYLMDEDELLGKIAVLLAGRAAEKEFLAKASTGAADDLAKATEIAHEMVVRLGMSEKLGLVSFEPQRPAYLLAPVYGEFKALMSEESARLIDAEVRRLIDRGFTMALGAIRANREFLLAGVTRLLAVETLDDVTISDLWQRLGTQPIPEIYTSSS